MISYIKKGKRNHSESIINLIKYFKNSFYSVGTIGLVALSTYHGINYANNKKDISDIANNTKTIEYIIPISDFTNSHSPEKSSDISQSFKHILFYDTNKIISDRELNKDTDSKNPQDSFEDHVLALYNLQPTKPLTEKEAIHQAVDRLEHVLDFETSSEKKYKLKAIERVLNYDSQLDEILAKYPNVGKNFVRAIMINETNGQIIIRDKNNPKNYLVNTNTLDTQGLLQIMQDGAFRFFYNALFKKTETDKNGDKVINESNKPVVCYHNKKLNHRYLTQLDSLAKYINETGNIKPRQVNVGDKQITINSVLVDPNKHDISVSAGEKISWQNFKDFLHEQYVVKKDYSKLPDVEIGIMYIDSFDRFIEFKNQAHLGAAYNAGPSVISKELIKTKKIVNFPETKKYVDDLSKNILILDLYENLKINKKNDIDLLSLGHYPSPLNLTYD